MKKTTLILLLLVGCLKAYTKGHGLIIAIGDYPQEYGWHDISSINDIPYIKTAMLSLGIEEQSITTLRDQDATYNNIIQSWTKLSHTVSSGDFVFVHFSGHGQQVIDRNQDEIDGYDEAIVPYDAPQYYKEDDYKGERHILDDDIGFWMHQIRRKLGPKGKIILVLDSCHSGTGTRSETKWTRGTEIRISPPTPQNKQISVEENKFGIIDKNPDIDLAPMACYFASGAYELNQECRDLDGNAVGSLSYAISQTIINAKYKLSFDDIFVGTQQKMIRLVPFQKPQWEFSGDKQIGFNIDEKNKYFDITFIDDELVKIEAGFVHGLHQNSIIEIISNTNSKIIARAEIIETGLSNSIAKLIEVYDVERSDLAKAKVVKYSNPLITCKIDYHSQAIWPSIKRKLEDYQFAQFESCNPHLVIIENPDSTISIYDWLGYDFMINKVVTAKTETINEITSIIKSFLLAEHIRTLSSTSIYLNGKTVVHDQHGNIVNNSQITLGKKLKLSVKNIGNKLFYYSLLYISPKSNIQCITPFGLKAAEDFYLPPGETWTYPEEIDTSEPIGKESIVLLMQEEPLSWVESSFNNSLSERSSNKANHFSEMINFIEGENTTRGKNYNNSISPIGVDIIHLFVTE